MCPPRRSRTFRHRNAGFSLIEILLVLALLALLAGVVVASSEALFSGFGDPPLDQQLRKAVREARFHAAREKEVTYLSFSWETGDFVISGESGATLLTQESGHPGEDPELTVRFFHLQPAKGLPRYSFETPDRRETPRVGFHPDRSSTPFLVELRYGNEFSEHRYDPFSDAEIEEDPSR